MLSSGLDAAPVERTGAANGVAVLLGSCHRADGKVTDGAFAVATMVRQARRSHYPMVETRSLPRPRRLAAMTCSPTGNFYPQARPGST